MPVIRGLMALSLALALGAAGGDLPDLERRAGQGDVRAEVSLALELQQPGHRNLDRSEALLRAAAGTGDAEAERCLGRFLHLVEGARRDYPEARRWYERAAAKGDLWAINNLGVMRHQGLIRDHIWSSPASEALPFYRKAAEGGFPMAQYNLAYCFYEGRGTSKDYRAAERWFLKSAEGGYSEAMVQLSYMYSKGDGVARDSKRGFEWAQQAAKAGSADGYYNLAWSYDLGDGTPKNRELAIRYYEEAARLGDSGSMHNLGLMYEEGGPAAVDYVKARQWYERAVAAGSVESRLNLGSIYIDGLGTTKDLKRGAQFVYWGAYAGDAGAEAKLGFMYFTGEGVVRDMVSGLAWSYLASEGGNPNGTKNVHLGEDRMSFADKIRARFRVNAIRAEIGRRRLAERLKKPDSRG